MCIIVAKEKGKAMPSKEILQKCFNNNPDGAGFMFAFKKQVYISKGYMDFDKFYNALKLVDDKIDLKKYGVVMHFRISTQGGVNQQCCHPYPLSKDMNDLKQLTFKSKIGVAHNGIIDLTSEGYYSTKKVDYNDTMKFITDYLSLIIKDKNYYKSADTMELIEKLCGSRLAILDEDGLINYIGTGWVKDNGIMYSNTTYKEAKTYKKYSYKGYDYDDWNDYLTNKYGYGSCSSNSKYNWEDEDDYDYKDDYSLGDFKIPNEIIWEDKKITINETKLSELLYDDYYYYATGFDEEGNDCEITFTDYGCGYNVDLKPIDVHFYNEY